MLNEDTGLIEIIEATGDDVTAAYILRALIELSQHRKYKGKPVSLSYQAYSDMFGGGISVQSVGRAMNRLEKMGFITKEIHQNPDINWKNSAYVTLNPDKIALSK